jgi:hypothetical protein
MSRRSVEIVILIASTAAAVAVGAYLLIRQGTSTRVGAESTQAGSGNDALLFVLVTVVGGTAAVTGVAAAFVQVNASRYRRLRASAQKAAAAPATAQEASSDPRLPELLAGVARDVADQLKLDPSQVRAALFLPDGQVLRIPPRLAVHFTNPDEASIAITAGQGSAGRAYESSQQNIAIYHQAQSDSSISDVNERHKVHPDLKWIISTPILGPDRKVVGVLNVDGLHTEQVVEQLEGPADGLVYWAELAGLLLGQMGNEQAGGAREHRGV